GFTASVQYGVGWGFGTGVQFIANLDFDDPQRMLGRLGDALADLARSEVTQFVSGLEEAQAEAARPAVAALSVLLPLATPSMFQLGVDLVAANPVQQEKAARSSVAKSLVTTAQQQLLTAAFSLRAVFVADGLAASLG